MSTPPNEPASLSLTEQPGHLNVEYDGATLLKGRVFVRQSNTLTQAKIGLDKTPGIVTVRQEVEQNVSASGIPCIKQKIYLESESAELILKALITSSEEGFTCEASPCKAQAVMPLLRTTVGGPSRSLRNDSIYDRNRDWVLTCEGAQFEPVKCEPTSRQFQMVARGKSIELQFRPHYYRAHKNIPYFEPWTYRVWAESVCGWCSWWAYKLEINENIVRSICDIFADKLLPYGFEYIQIDAGYQSGEDGTPDCWLKTHPERFPNGLESLLETIQTRRLKPALWLSVHFRDMNYVYNHRNWFVTTSDGEVHKARNVFYGIDGFVPEAIDEILRPVYQTLRKQGWQYVKIDTLRHLLYDSYYANKEYFTNKGLVLEEGFRNVIRAIREEMGEDTYILACWGVLPEVAGIENGCRLGPDGFGPQSLLQYNSWNNVVWRNDPDHMDITPEGEEWIRPVAVTMAGAQMLLTDRVEVYADDSKIEGAKRCAPVLFSLPGQLYDFDTSKSENVRTNHRIPDPYGKGSARTTDADQHGKFCEWWLMEINRDFDRWYVLARMDYKDLPAAKVSFANLGLPEDREYLVFEYRGAQFLGSFKGEFPVPAQKARDVKIYAIRENLRRPQILGTNRHITCGGPDLLDVKFERGVLKGKSLMVGGDAYRIYLHMPAGSVIKKVEAKDAQAISHSTERKMGIIEIMVDKSKEVEWKVEIG